MRSYLLGLLGGLTAIVLFVGYVNLFGMPGQSRSVGAVAGPTGRTNGPPVGAPLGGAPARGPQPTVDPTVQAYANQLRGNAAATAVAQRESACANLQALYNDHRAKLDRSMPPDLIIADLLRRYGVSPDDGSLYADSLSRHVREQAYACAGR